jgi:hypothetical protein
MNDLGQPMPVTAYFTAVGLRALMQDPTSVRTWPQQQMFRVLSHNDI